MQRALIALLASALPMVVPGGGLAQDVGDVVPVGTPVRVVILGSNGSPMPGEVAATRDGCSYVAISMGRDNVLGVPLRDVMRMQARTGEREQEPGAGLPVPDARTAPRSWLDVDVEALRQRRPERCRGQPFSRVTPLRIGVLLRP